MTIEKKVIINVSNLSKGGGAQIAVWLINLLLHIQKYRFVFLVSPHLFKLLNPPDSVLRDFYVVQESPVRSVKAKKQILTIVAEQQPSLVYTLYGPSGVNFPCPEISGVANAWISCATLTDFFRVHGALFLFEKLKYIIHGLNLRKKSFLTFETTTSRDNYCKRFFYNKNKTTVIPNTVNSYFNAVDSGISNVEAVSNFKILYVAAFYKHKNIHLLPGYALALKKSKKISQFTFQLTLPETDFENVYNSAKKMGVEMYFENLGVLNSSELPAAYENANMVFSPSSLETFSAVYAEAIISNKYLAVSDKLFTREICKDAALYFDPLDVNSVRVVIEKIYMNDGLEKLDAALENKSSYFITPEKRFELMLELFDKELK